MSATKQVNFSCDMDLVERMNRHGMHKAGTINLALRAWLDTCKPEGGARPMNPLDVTPEIFPRKPRRRLTNKERLACGGDVQARWDLMETPAPAPGLEDEPEDELSTD